MVYAVHKHRDAAPPSPPQSNWVVNDWSTELLVEVFHRLRYICVVRLRKVRHRVTLRLPY